ncbi:MAG: MarR family transcriptional regulator [Deltaproteobacteria bacterium]
MNMSPDDIQVEDVDLGDLEHSLGFLLRIGQVQIFRAYFRHLGRFDLMPAELSILWVLHLNPDVKQGAVAQSLSIKAAHMTKLIQKLVTGGYVVRTVPEGDRRSVLLSLTDAGYAFVAENADVFINLHKLAPGHLDPDELTDLSRLLRKYIGYEGGAT